jgi:uncharacterized protein HemX
MGFSALEVALMVGVGTMAAGSAYQGYSQNSQASDAKRARQEQMDQATAELKQRNLDNTAKDAQARNQAALQRKRDYQNLGQGGTILTSPMGLPGESPSKTKTMLGY